MRKLFHKKGFTLIELLVVIVIMSLITLAFISNQSKFDSSTVMRSLAYSVALSIRQAQVYGVSVRGTTQSGTTSFTASHGVDFQYSAASPSFYTLFADINNNNFYDVGSDLIDQKFTLNNEYKISEVCAVTSAGTKRCSGSDDSSGVGTITAVDVLFTRPNPDARIYAYFNSSPIVPPEVYSSGYIKISAINGDARFIAVTTTGEITICSVGAAIGSAGC